MRASRRASGWAWPGASRWGTGSGWAMGWGTGSGWAMGWGTGSGRAMGWGTGSGRAMGWGTGAETAGLAMAAGDATGPGCWRPAGPARGPAGPPRAGGV